jgi:hypothetical protein
MISFILEARMEKRQIYQMESNIFSECEGCTSALERGTEELSESLTPGLGKREVENYTTATIIVRCENISGTVLADTEVFLDGKMAGGVNATIDCPGLRKS